MSRNTREVVLSADLATNGTFTVGYDSGWNGGHFTGGADHKITSSYGVWRSSDGDFNVSFGASSATVTYLGATTVAQGTHLWVEFDAPGRTSTELTNVALPTFANLAPAVLINLGAPAAADRDGLFASAVVGGSGELTLATTLANADGVITFDVPRNVEVYSAGNASGASFTVTGTDVFGNAMTETIAGPDGTPTVTQGLKAFKTVTSITASAGSGAAVEIGTGDILGLPVYLPSADLVVVELEDWAAASAGTLVAGLDANTESTATTGDVRGTYDPASAANGSRSFALIAFLPTFGYEGNAQYSA